MALQPGQSLTVEITASVPCSYSGGGAWTVLAKQANNFNGPPGNNVAVVGDLVTPVTGGCGLAFGTLPAAAEVGAAITGTPFSPSGPPVTVLVVDGSGQPLPGATVPITLSLAPGSGFGPLSGTTTRDHVRRRRHVRRDLDRLAGPLLAPGDEPRVRRRVHARLQRRHRGRAVRRGRPVHRHGDHRPLRAHPHRPAEREPGRRDPAPLLRRRPRDRLRRLHRSSRSAPPCST